MKDDPVQNQPDNQANAEELNKPEDQIQSNNQIEDQNAQKQKKSSPLKILVLLATLVGVVVVGFLLFINFQKKSSTVTQPSAKSDIVVGVSLGTLRVERWKRDLAMIEETAQKEGISIISKSANDDPNIQISQAENLISQGVDVLIVIPSDSEKVSPIIEKAHEKGIKVIAYDRMILGPDLDYYISFDNEKVGEFQAQGVVDKAPKGKYVYIGGATEDNNAHLLKTGSMKVLQPLIDSGDITLELETFTPEWRAEEAYSTMKTYLSSGKTVDGVVAANDGTADGVIQALKEFDLAGKVPVSGQDAELTACQRVVEGTQTVTVYKPIRLLAQQAVMMAIQIAKGDEVNANSVVSNGTTDVPSVLLSSIPVTQANMIDEVIRDNFHEYEDVYKNILQNERPPKN